MRLCIRRDACFQSLKQIFSIKFLFRVTCLSLVASIFWIQLSHYTPPTHSSLTQEALNIVSVDSRYAEIYRKSTRLPKGLKFLLLWTPQDFAPFYYFGFGQRQFIQNNCSVINCYVTSDRRFLDGDLTRFDAIAFNGRSINHLNKNQLPQTRSPHQKYMFFNLESASNYPICNPIYDNFFNWTSTYRLDSDVPYFNILIRDNQSNVIGPKKNMKWIENMDEVDEEFYRKLQRKRKAAAWFVSNCNAKSGRQEFVNKLQNELYKYKLRVDIYGQCGPLECPRDRQSECDMMLERDYFFYMSLENSFAEDYVTEKLLTALHHNAVPIVFGGADYTRFLPPGSYLDGQALGPKKLAELMHLLMKSPRLYSQFFRWKKYYTFHNPTEVEDVCVLCEALNNKTMSETPTGYHNFREWWYPNYKQVC